MMLKRQQESLQKEVFAVSNKVRKSGLVISLITAVATLAACGDVEAGLTDKQYKTKLIEDDSKIANNEIGKIYDALVKSGTTNSEKVLNNVLLSIAEGQFGSFYDSEWKGNAVKGLHTIVTEGDASIDEFVLKHKKAYGYSKEADKEEAREKVKIFHNYLLERINRAFMGYVSDSSFAENDHFFEERFYHSKRNDLYDIGTKTENTIAETDFKGIVAGKSVGVQVGVSSVYNEKTNYGTTEVKKYFNDNYLTIYKDYIEKSILPELMRKSLVEQYLYDRNYVTLGRSSARKVQYVGIADNANYPTAVKNLVRTYAKVVISQNDTTLTLTDAELTTIATYYQTSSYDLNFLADLYKGYFDWTSAIGTVAKKIYDRAGWTWISQAITPSLTYSAYRESTFGGYLTDYAKINLDDRYTNETEVYNDFTSTGTRSAAVGMERKIDSLQTVDYTTEGWFTDSSLSGLPADYKTRLFKISVANDVDSSYEASHSDFGETTNFGWYVKGNYYLTRSTYERTSDDTDPNPYLLYDEASSTWYIARVDEAVKSTKMRVGGSLDTKKGVAYRNQVAREIMHLLSDNASYTKSANQYYVEKAALSFHDDDVYNYFADTFPDLFEK